MDQDNNETKKEKKIQNGRKTRTRYNADKKKKPK